MKNIVSIVVCALILISCDKNVSYLDQITKEKPITERAKDLNISMQNVRKAEKGKLIKEDVDYMEYEYKIGEGDSYVISYLFDDKGAYEIGFDGYFAKKEDAKAVLDGFKQQISATPFGKPDETPRLSRWLNPDQSVTIELDYSDIDKGLAVVTIFANE